MPQVPIAVTQAAALKSAAGKAGQSKPEATPNINAVRQDLAVMADQAKGYTEGINAGVIVAQDNRQAQAARFAAEKAANDARRAQEAQMAAIQQQEAALRREAANAEYGRRKKDLQIEQAVKQSEPEEADLEAARRVQMHMASHTTAGFQRAFSSLLNMGVTSPGEMVAILDNLNKDEDSPFRGTHRETLLRYARAHFNALEGRAVDLSFKK